MAPADPKTVLHRTLDEARDALLWKLDSLGEYDARRPLTPTGTNLLGLVKHLTGVEFGYFGEPFGRPARRLPAWLVPGAEDSTAEENVDMWAKETETRQQILDDYRAARAHADATIAALPLDAAGRVEPWPPDRRDVTLHEMLVLAIAETHRHAGHADIVRELVDGSVGRLPDDPASPRTRSELQAHWDRVHFAAERADHPV